MERAQQFCDRLELRPQPPASNADLAAAAQTSGLDLPPDLLDFYRFSNGLSVGACEFEILSIEKASGRAARMREMGFPEEWGYFPFTESGDSNSYCVCCNAPVRSRIVLVQHDNVARLDFQSLSSFFDGIEHLARRRREAAGQTIDDSGEDEEPGPLTFWMEMAEHEREYAGHGPRGEDDVATGLELLQLAPTLSDSEVAQHDAFRFALALLDQRHVPAIEKLLDEDEYVRQDVIDRLKEIGTDQARRAIRKFERDYRSFVEHAVNALRAAGLRVTVSRETHVRLDDGPLWLNMEMIYGWRNDPDPWGRIIRRANELLQLQRGEPSE
jgi:hypothetical protein